MTSYVTAKDLRTKEQRLLDRYMHFCAAWRCIAQHIRWRMNQH